MMHRSGAYARSVSNLHIYIYTYILTIRAVAELARHIGHRVALMPLQESVQALESLLPWVRQGGWGGGGGGGGVGGE